MLVVYRCGLCGNEIRKIYSSSAVQASYLTCVCAGNMERQLPKFSTSSVETVDTGSMARKVELRKDVIDRSKERGDKYIKNLEKLERPLKKDEN